MKAATRTRRQWVTKHGSGFCATGKMMKLWGKRATAKCPRCDQEEDATHVRKCTGNGADEVWMKSMERLKQEMIQASTLPNLIEVLCDQLTAWRNDVAPTVPISNVLLGLRATIAEQDNVGWQAMLEGLPVVGWAEVQQRYLEWRKNDVLGNDGWHWLSKNYGMSHGTCGTIAIGYCTTRT
jgi:hypothetical protein